VVGPTQALYLAIWGLVLLERFGELFLSKRNADAAFAAGGIEAGKAHWPAMVVLHALFPVACIAEVLVLGRPMLPWLAALCGIGLLSSMALRYWAIATLGVRWNARIIVVPGLEAVGATGPYRFIRHPNYVAVFAEFLVLPLLHSAWLTALVFSLANALLLRTRIRTEEQALREHCGYEAAQGRRPRFMPGTLR
jgi:methyltransferase